ncbi:DUF7312 domain-containing protein [Halomarina ordinaria]|uniref:DUF7312 domain-containing protein n=1 Tax=Halomarina ordinaria TaxID=3033939 RepID=A0ABD5U7T9_9EURY|nr:hypothetical protein [Halomarina sp. PSRA2]
MADDDEWRFTPEGNPVEEERQPMAADPEPESPTFENTFFVVLGAVATVGVFLVMFL